MKIKVSELNLKSIIMIKRNEPTLSKGAKRCIIVIGIIVVPLLSYLFYIFMATLFGIFFCRKTHTIKSESPEQSIERGAYLFKYSSLPCDSINIFSERIDSLDVYAEKNYYYKSDMKFINSITIRSDQSRIYLSLRSKEYNYAKLDIGTHNQVESRNSKISFVVTCYKDPIPPDTIKLILSESKIDKPDTLLLVREFN